MTRGAAWLLTGLGALLAGAAGWWALDDARAALPCVLIAGVAFTNGFDHIRESF